MKRKRITKPILVRSSNPENNSLLVRKAKQRIRRIEKTRAVNVLIRNIKRFTYIDPDMK